MRGRWRRWAWLGFVGAPTLLASGHVQANSFGSAAWFNQAGSPPATNTAPAQPGLPALPNGVTTPDVAKIRADRSLRDLQRALTNISDERAAQRSAAQQLSLESASVPDGLTPGGLQIAIEAPELKGDAAACVNAAQCIWVNAELPTQSSDAGRTTVTIKQTDDKAILTWESFNVGSKTDLVFNQSAGTQADGKNDWIALNRVKPGADPSLIQGRIKAEGSVYLINQNGILFDAGSSVDTHSLMVSTLPLYLADSSDNLRAPDAADIAYSNLQFLNGGPLSSAADSALGSVLGLPQRGSGGNLTLEAGQTVDDVLPGDLRIAQGARLSVSDDGFGLFAAPNIRVEGSIEAIDSQVALVAGIGVQVTRSNITGRRFDISSIGRVIDAAGNEVTPTFSIENHGLISSMRGGVTLLGAELLQDGVLFATTSVARQGYIDLLASDSTGQQRRYGEVRFTGDSTTALLPDDQADKTNSSPSADAQFNPLAINVVGAAITLDSGALIEAPGHDVKLTAVAEDSVSVLSLVDEERATRGRIYLAPGSVIDVAGLAGIEVPLSNVLISVPRIGQNELADSPLQRGGPLFGNSLIFDLRDRGVREDGIAWVGSPLANLAGYVENIQRGVRELLTDGGDIRLIGNEVLADRGSLLNLAGGYLQYKAGINTASRLVTATGSIIDIANADPNVRYIGFAGQAIQQHPRWNVSRVFVNPVLAAAQAGVYEEADIEGGRGGTLTVYGQATALIGATVDAHAVSGRRQVNAGAPTPGGTLQWGGDFGASVFPEADVPLSGPSYAIVETIDPELFEDLGPTSPAFERGFDAEDILDPAWFIPISASQVRASGASALRVLGDLPDALAMGGEIVVDDARVVVTPGGNVSFSDGSTGSASLIELSGSRVAVDGSLTAESGRISITTTGRTFLEGSSTAEAGEPVVGDLLISARSVLSVAGQFVNDTNKGQNDLVLGTYVDGGRIELRSLQSSLTLEPATDTDAAVVQNLTGSIRLAAGSTLDVSSGAYVDRTGRLLRTLDNVVIGSAGVIDIGTYVANGAPFGRNPNLATPSDLFDGAGQVELGARLLGYGFERGGALRLRAPGIVIGAGSGTDELGALQLDETLFSAGGVDPTGALRSGGFADFRLDSIFDATLLAGNDVIVSQRNLLATGTPGTPIALGSIATGATLSQTLRSGAVVIGSLDDLRRQPSSFALYSGDYLNWIARDPLLGEFVPQLFDDYGITGRTLVDSAARIIADARSTVTLGSHNQVTLLGSIISPGGHVVLTVDTANGGYSQNPGSIVDPYAIATKSVWLGSQSLIDVSGTTLFDTSSVPPGIDGIPIGEVIDGGTVVLTADTGYVFALSCADSGDCDTAPTNTSTGTAPVAAVATPIAKLVQNDGGASIKPMFGSNTSSGGSTGGGGSSGGSGDDDTAARSGATIRVSGASGRVAVLDCNNRSEVIQQLFSDAGSITVGAGAGLFFNPVIEAQAGGTSAQGGTLSIVPLQPRIIPLSDFEGATRLVIGDTSPTLPVPLPDPDDETADLGVLEPGQAFTMRRVGTLRLGTDILKNSGIATLRLGSDPTLSTSIPVPIDIVTDLSLSLAREISINTSELTAKPAIPERGKPKALDVSLSAPYVSLHGYAPGALYGDVADRSLLLPFFRDLPISTLSVNSTLLDIGGQILIEGFRDTTLAASDEIRFVTPAAYANLSVGNGAYVSVPGAMLVGGNLTLRAPRIYPATGQTQILLADNYREYDIDVVITPRVDEDEDGEADTEAVTIKEPSTATITFESIANQKTNTAPLSVGGRLLVGATQIEQNGNLFAPGGQIVLGLASDPNRNDPTLLSYATGSSDTAFLTLPVTRSVTYGTGSLTSVSLAGLTLPYGSTIDGANLVYNGTGDRKATGGVLTQSPDKSITSIAQSIDIRSGATVDIRGGGELFATEFVAGTGGTRNILNTSNVSFAGGTESNASLYADGRAVYAILPGYNGVAPYDPAYATAASANAPLAGQAVYLTGIEGLADGVYTLLPGAYAVLPGAMRLVEDTRIGARDAIAPLTNQVLADGSYRVAGYYVDQLSGTRSSRSGTFVVQNEQTWRQYSQIDLTSLNAYFNNAEVRGGQLLRAPGDAGRLALATVNRLSLDGSLLTSRPTGFQGAELQLAAPRIEVISGNATATSGYLTLSADALNAIGASRIVIGATTSEFRGVLETFTVAADNINIGSIGEALRADEIVLVSRGNVSGDGITLRPGARLIAEGTPTGRRGLFIDIGAEATIFDEETDEPLDDISGNGAYLQVSVNAPNLPGRNNVTGTAGGPDGLAYGSVRIGEGAVLQGSGAIGIEGTGTLDIADSVKLSTASFSASTGSIAITGGRSSGVLGDLVVGSALQKQLQSIAAVSLQASESIRFVDDATLEARDQLTLDTGSLIGVGATAQLAADVVSLTNRNGVALSGAFGLGSLRIDAGELQLMDLSSGDIGISGFARIVVNASRGVAAVGSGSLSLSGANFDLTTPLLTANTAANLSIRGVGALTANTATNGSATPLPQGFGGRVDIAAGRIDWDTRATIAGGVLTMSADDDLHIGSNARLSTDGGLYTAFDRRIPISAGLVVLQSQQGDVQLDAGSMVSVDAAASGDAGGIRLLASAGNVITDGALRGRADAEQRGASLSIDSRNIDVDRIAALTRAGSIDGRVALTATEGDLVLSGSERLTAQQVLLDARAGDVTIDGTVDAAQRKDHAEIAIYGRQGVQINGALLAAGGAEDRSGGRIRIGTSAMSVNRYDATFGYQSVNADEAGAINIASTAILDVRGGDGRVELRAPILSDGRVPVSVAAAAQIIGSAAPTLEAVARWDAGDATQGAQHFNGVIDPSALEGDTDAAAFITGTLQQFVQSPNWVLDTSLGQVQSWRHRVGIDLTHDDGDIRIASNWNLAAGSLAANGLPLLDWRTLGVAPAISLRASGNVLVGASISDGFFQTVNPFGGATANQTAASGTDNNPLPLATASLLGLASDGKAYDSSTIRLIAGAAAGSANPTAVNGAINGQGDVILSGHQSAVSNAVGNEGREVVVPTMVRTGVGDIDVVAQRDIRFTDIDAPATIYTAGHANVFGAVRPVSSQLTAVAEGQIPVLDSGLVQPRDGGDVSLQAGRDIRGLTRVTDTTGARSGFAGTELTQYWWPWMQSPCIVSLDGCTQAATQASINFAMFGQGVLSLGNVRVAAGRDVDSLAVSLPTTWLRSEAGIESGIGGGDLSVDAVGNIAAGSFFVSEGRGDIRAMGAFGRNASQAPIIALQDAKIAVAAAQGANVGGIFNPSYLFSGFDSNAYSVDSAVSIVAASGNITVGSVASIPGSQYGANTDEGIRSPVQEGASYLLPAHLQVVAAAGNVTLTRGGELFPAADGQLELIAQRNLQFLGRGNGNYLGLIDAPRNLLPSITNPLLPNQVPRSFIDLGGQSNVELRSPELLHAFDLDPMRLYSVTGSLFNGDTSVRFVNNLPVQAFSSAMRVYSDKPADIRAGLDIVNLWFSGQNLYESDITTISAGRDLYDPILQPAQLVPVIDLAGPGTLAISAGRNLGPITSAGDARNLGYLTGQTQYPGIRTTGNTNNLYLPRNGANISISYGIGPGMALDEFAATYLDPSVLHDPLDPADSLGTPDYSRQLVSFVRQILVDRQQRERVDLSSTLSSLDAASAYQIFQSLPTAQRQRLIGDVFLDLLNQVGLDYNGVKRVVIDSRHPEGVEYNADNIRFQGQYGRGYAAIEALFPAQFGYTENVLDGSRNGAVSQVTTGSLDIRGSTIQTRYGGNIDILGPGGPVLVGSASAPPFTAATSNTAAVGPSSQGILALQAGDVRLFSDQSVLLAQSRIFTQQGGDLLLWSSNGDINAGKGAKTSSEVPPLLFSCDNDLFCVVDTSSQVSGAGIAALQTKPGGRAGSANLIAPVGTVDAGDAGIRVSGNLNVAAAQIANADNIQVSGAKIGVPTGVVDTAAVSVAGSVAAAVAQSADQAASNQKRNDTELELFIEFLTLEGP